MHPKNTKKGNPPNVKVAAPPSSDAATATTTHDDGTFIRTALVCDHHNGSVDLVAADGTRLAQVNIFYASNSDGHECLIVDVIDVDKRYSNLRALAFSNEKREIVNVPPGGNLVSVDFRRPVPGRTGTTQ